MGKFASPTPAQAADLQDALKHQDRARRSLIAAGHPEEVQRWAAEYIRATDAAYDVAKDVTRGFACPR